MERPDLDAGPADQRDPAPDREGALVRLPARSRHLVPGAHGQQPRGRQLGRGVRLRPGHRRRACGATRRSTPRTGKPFNIWCAGQTLLRDGRVVVAGGNCHYYGYNGINRYRGHDVVLTFNPFTETWTYQGRHAPTGAGTRPSPSWRRPRRDRGRPRRRAGNGDDNNRDIEVFTPSADMNGVGCIQTVGDAVLRDLPPHVPDAGRQAASRSARDEDDTYIINPATWSVSNTQDRSPCRREWGAATLLPSGPAGPTKLLMTGGSDIDASQLPTARTGPLRRPTHLSSTSTGAIRRRARRRSAGPQPRQHTILPDGTLFTNGGGVGASTTTSTRARSTPPSSTTRRPGRWTETNPQVDERTYHSTSLLIPDGRVISMGDDRHEHLDNDPNGASCARSSTTSRRTSSRARGRRSPRPGGTPYGVPVGIGTPDGASPRPCSSSSAPRPTRSTPTSAPCRCRWPRSPGGIQFTTPANPNAAPPGYYSSSWSTPRACRRWPR